VHVLCPLACCQVTSKAVGVEGKHREQCEGISSWVNREHYGGITVVVPAGSKRTAFFCFSCCMICLDRQLFLRPQWLAINSSASRYRVRCTYLVKGEISYFVYWSRKRRDVYVVRCSLDLIWYCTSQRAQYKDQTHKNTSVGRTPCKVSVTLSHFNQNRNMLMYL